jgi:chemotaxis protein MotA
MLIIGGAGVGALIIGNSSKNSKRWAASWARSSKGPKYNRGTISIASSSCQAHENASDRGPVAVEPHIRIRHHQASLHIPSCSRMTLIHLITDTLRLLLCHPALDECGRT